VCLFVRLRLAAAIVEAMAWEVQASEQVQRWQRSLEPLAAERLNAAVARLQELGPGLGRPFVDTIHGSRHANMKELRVGSLRTLFAFDARRHAMLLVGGDKAGDWRGWYQRNIPVADRLFDAHQRSIGGGGQQWARGTGVRSVASGR
jgi:hypothetical protein